MKKLTVSLLALYMLCTGLAGCTEPDKLTATLCGQVEEVNSDCIILVPGQMKDNTFVANETSLRIDLAEEAAEIAQDIPVGAVIDITLQADADKGFDVSYEIIMHPQNNGA